MTLAGVLGFIFCMLVIGGAGIALDLVHLNMVDEVNQHLSERERFSPYWWGPWKTMRLLRDYRRLFPQGKRIRQMRSLALLSLLALVCSAFIFGFTLDSIAFVGVGGALSIWLTFRSPKTA